VKRALICIKLVIRPTYCESSLSYSVRAKALASCSATVCSTIGPQSAARQVFKVEVFGRSAIREAYLVASAIRDDLVVDQPDWGDHFGFALSPSSTSRRIASDYAIRKNPPPFDLYHC
jgi:hypothetical protein